MLGLLCLTECNFWCQDNEPKRLWLIVTYTPSGRTHPLRHVPFFFPFPHVARTCTTSPLISTLSSFIDNLQLATIGPRFVSRDVHLVLGPCAARDHLLRRFIPSCSSLTCPLTALDDGQTYIHDVKNMPTRDCLIGQLDQRPPAAHHPAASGCQLRVKTRFMDPQAI